MHQQRRTRDEGFTLVELMVTLLVISVLLAIAVPTFLAARERADNRVAQANTTSGLKAHRTFTANPVNLAGFSADQLGAALKGVEPALTVAELPAAGPQVKGVVYIRKELGSAVVALVSRSETGRCYWSRDDNGVTSYAADDCDTDFDNLVWSPRAVK